MESLHDFIEFCNKDIEFLSFLSDFREYVSGTFTACDLICVDFLVDGKISDCCPSGKYMTKGFLFKLLKLHLSTTSPKWKKCNEKSVFVGNIDCRSFLGFRKKTDKTPKFKANVQFLGAVLNYVLTHSPLDWNGLEFGESIESNDKFPYIIKKIYTFLEKEVTNRRKSKEDKDNFLRGIFDPSPFFAGYSSVLKKAKLVKESVSSGSQNGLETQNSPSVAEIVPPEPASTMVSQSVTSESRIVSGAMSVSSETSSTSTELLSIAFESENGADESFPSASSFASQTDMSVQSSEGLSGPSVSAVTVGSKRKRTFQPKCQRVVPEAGKVSSNRNKILVWRSSYKYKLSQIDRLKSQVRDLKVKLANKNTQFLNVAVSAANKDSAEIIQNLKKTVQDYDEELSKKDEQIKKLKAKYKSLKDDYEAETFLHYEQTCKLEEEIASKETDEIIDTFANAFQVKEIPLVKMRNGLKNINPEVLKILSILKLAVGLSLRKCVLSLVLVGNHIFGQKWKLPKNSEYKQNARINRCMPAPQKPIEQDTVDDGESARYKDIDDHTAPAPTYLKNAIEAFIEPNAFGSIFEELKDPNTQYSTISCDHYSEHRQKHQTSNLMTSKFDPKTGKNVVGYRCLGLTDAYKTTGEATSETLKRYFQLGAILTAKSDDAEDILTSLKQILAKVKYSVTDGASNMKSAIEHFSEWRSEMTGITNDFIWIHCNAHVLPALTGATEKYLKAVEKMLDLRMYVCQDFNKMFFKVSDSVIVTIFSAIFRNVGPSSKNQEYACTTQFHAYLKSIGEPLNRFFDPQSARFGKVTEMGMIIAYNFKILKKFFELAFMPNTLFKACELYMSCPGLYEISLAMTCTYYHLLGPFKIACGADKIEGYYDRRLPHSSLLKFYKAFEKTLKELADDPAPLLKIAVLPRMAEFNLHLLTKSHYGIVSFVVEELNTNADINIDVVKGVLKLTCEEYLIAVVRQANEFYIKDGSIIEKALEADEHALDNVPTTALAAERSVALAHDGYKKAPNANTRTHSNVQMISTSPFFIEFAAMDAEKIAEMIKNTKKSKLFEIIKKFNQRTRELQEEALQGTVAELAKKRDDQAKSKALICSGIKAHGGPLESPEEVDMFVRDFQGTTDELRHAIDLELKYRKKVINDRTINPDLYKCREKDKSNGGKYRIFTVEERIDNLKQVVKPIPDEIVFPLGINTDKFKNDVDEYHSTLKSYPHRKGDVAGSGASASTSLGQNSVQPLSDLVDPVKITDSIDYIAAYYDGEQQLWYPGIVTKCIDSESCECCNSLAGIEGSSRTCYMARFMSPTGLDIYEISDDLEYHVHPSQLLTTPIIEYVQLDHGGLGYKVLNHLAIDDSVKDNLLYRCLQDSLPDNNVPKNKGKASKGKRRSHKK